jgi:hypothetical protein
MPDLTLHFKLAPGADKAAVAHLIEEQLGASPDVETATVDSDQSTRFVFGGAEVIAAITVAGQIAGSVTAVITALQKIQELVKAAAQNGGVQKVLLDVGYRSVPIEELTEADKEEVAEQLTAAR